MVNATLITASAVANLPMFQQLRKAMINWFSCVYQILIHIFIGDRRLVQLFQLVGLGHPWISSSSPNKPLTNVEVEVEFSVQHSWKEPENQCGLGNNDDRGDDQDLQNMEKLTVVLDLDETLVSACDTSSLPAAIRSQAIGAGLKWFEMECVAQEKSEGDLKTCNVTAFERPGLQRFLQHVGEFADLVLFTAALEGYAAKIVDEIDKESRFCLRLYRPSTVSTQYREHVKDLACLSKDPSRIVIVDNNPFSFLRQPLNGIPCVPFCAAQPHDDQLLEVLLPLLRHLSKQRDVRPILYDRFHMPEWFRRQGIPIPHFTG